MDRLKKIDIIREKLKDGRPSVGSWIQIPHTSIAEIMGNSGYDWIALDLEHGSISPHQLPDLFRSLEAGGTLPMARLISANPDACKQALDAGAGGVILPSISSADQLKVAVDSSRWPPAGKRGVGFSRANLFGKNFDIYRSEAQAPLVVAMLESVSAMNSIEDILEVEGLDAVMIGPYDLSASLGITGEFLDDRFKNAMDTIKRACVKAGTPYGLHVVHPSVQELSQRVAEGYQFIAYSIDAVFLHESSRIPDTSPE